MPSHNYLIRQRNEKEKRKDDKDNYYLRMISTSSGTERHELTSHFAFDSVFKFFTERLGSEDEPDISDNQDEVSQTQTDGEESAAEPACEANGATEDKPEPMKVDPAPEQEPGP